MDAYSSEQFNTDILDNLTEEICQDMESAAKQYLLIKDYLRRINLRLQRALRDGRLALVYTLEVQRDSTAGVLCMYGEYIQRKAYKHQEIQQYREEACM